MRYRGRIGEALGAVLLIDLFIGGAAPLFRSAMPEDNFSIIPEKLQPFVTSGEIAGAVALVADKD